MDGNKTFVIESQIIDTEEEAKELADMLHKAKADGYTHVQDAWGHNACDEYTIDEAIARFGTLKSN